MWRTAVVSVVRAFPQTCYYEGDQITNIVGLVPPIQVMLGKPKKGEKQSIGPKGELNHIAELPSEWWKHANNSQQGCNYRTVVTIGNLPVTGLLDGGSGINSVTEEMLVGILNRAWA